MEDILAQTTESESACDRDPMSWECSMEYLYGPDGLFSLAQIEAEEYDLAQVSQPTRRDIGKGRRWEAWGVAMPPL